MPDDSDLSNAAGKLTVITDLESNPVTVDHNPAHFDGFLHEIAEWSQRTGKFLELLEHGITFHVPRLQDCCGLTCSYPVLSRQGHQREDVQRRRPLPSYRATN